MERVKQNHDKSMGGCYNGKMTLTVGKEIDAISGATTSVHRLTDAVINKTRKLQEILHQ